MLSVDNAVLDAGQIRPCALESTQLAAWGLALERKLLTTVYLLTPEQVEQIMGECMPRLVAAPTAYEDIYAAWIAAKIDYSNGEYEKYQNSLEMYNAIYDELVLWVCTNHDPAQKTQQEREMTVRGLMAEGVG